MLREIPTPMSGHGSPSVFANGQLSIVCHGETLVWIDSKSLEIEIEQRLVSVPDSRMLLAGDDTPWTVG
jgi:hypothetical protein